MRTITLLAACIAAGTPAQERSALREVRRVATAPELTQGVGLTRDGTRAAVVLADGRLRLWDVARWVAPAEFEVGTGDSASELLFFGGDRYLALDEAGERLVDLDARAVVAPTAPLRSALAEARAVDAADYWSRRVTAPARNRAERRDALVVAADRKARVELWRPKEDPQWRRPVYRVGELQAYLADSGPRPLSLAFTADSRFLCVVRETRVVIAPLDGGATSQLPHPGLARDLPLICPGEAGAEIWRVDRRGATLWNVALGRALRTVDGGDDDAPWPEVTGLLSSRNSRYLAIRSNDVVHVVDLDDGTNIATSLSGANAVAWGTNGETLIGGFGGDFMFDALSGYLTVVPLDGGPASAALETDMTVRALSPVPGTGLVLAANYHEIALFDFRRRRAVAAVEAPGLQVIALSADRAITASESEVTLRALPSLAAVDALMLPDVEIRSMCAAPDGAHVAIELTDEIVILSIAPR